QGWSEPNAGSDLASLTCKATRDDARGGWVLDGQKTWTTRGAFCTHLFGLFRSDPQAERHRGLTYFLVPLDADGVTVRPVERLDGDEGFAEVFLEDVFVDDVHVLGEVNRGWNVAMATTSSERGLTLRSPGRFTATVDRLVDLYGRRGAQAPASVRERVTQAWMHAEAYRLYTLADVTDIVENRPPGARSSLNKLWWSELDIELHEVALDLLGAHGELEADASDAVDGGSWMKGYQFSLAGPIYAGTNEIQRNIVAERVLGLPRA
ncbi:MAG: acyl-CoA dehydrogenase family protein, partial [Acidimicrobiales bacterium]|nr:acyl-CoA dehydrogenase family protein [Acidimicrobiales bacterium]